MARNTIPEFSASADDNTDIAGLSIAEGWAAASINNAIRLEMALMKQYLANVDTLTSATSIDLGAAVGNFVTITGTTTITALGTVAAGTWKDVTFSGSLSMTYNATTLILPGAVDLAVSAGDTARFISLGSGNWMLTQLQRAVGPIAFAASKNGVDQTGILPSTSTKVTFTTELIDVGGYYDTANSQWSPPAGYYMFIVQLSLSAGLTDQAVIAAQLRRNGGIISESKARCSGTGALATSLQVIGRASAGDVFDIAVFSDGVGNKTVSGLAIDTFFQGFRLGGI